MSKRPAKIFSRASCTFNDTSASPKARPSRSVNASQCQIRIIIIFMREWVYFLWSISLSLVPDSGPSWLEILYGFARICVWQARARRIYAIRLRLDRGEVGEWEWLKNPKILVLTARIKWLYLFFAAAWPGFVCFVFKSIGNDGLCTLDLPKRRVYLRKNLYRGMGGLGWWVVEPKFFRDVL